MCTDHDLHLTLLPSNNDGHLFSRKRQQAELWSKVVFG